MSTAAPPTPPPLDEDEVGALAALNESIPLNNSLFANNSLTMQLQSEVFTTSSMKLMPLSSTNRLNATPT